MNVTDIVLSKRLSWLLRHGAVKEGLQISSEGYIEVNGILQHKSINEKYKISDIERIVNTNDKQRFKLRVNPSTGLLEIKANQGHTLKTITDEGLTPLLKAEYKTVIHGTYHKSWPQIKNQGLSRMNRNHIHFTKETLDDKTLVSGLRHNAQIHIFVDLQRALNDGLKFYESDNGVILTPGNDKGCLETKYFEKVIDIKSGEKLFP